MPDAGPVDPPAQTAGEYDPGEFEGSEWDEYERNEQGEYYLTPWELEEYDPPVPDVLEVVANTDFSGDGVLELSLANITDAQLAGIMAGAITNWSQFGLRDQPIRVVIDPAAGRATAAIRGLLQTHGYPASAYPAGIPAHRQIDVESAEEMLGVVANTVGTIGAVSAEWSFTIGWPQGQNKPVDNGQRPTAEFSLDGMGAFAGPNGVIPGTPIQNKAFQVVGYRMPTIRLKLETATTTKTYDFPVSKGRRVEDQVAIIVSRLSGLGWDVEKLPGGTGFLVRGYTDPASGQFQDINKAGIFTANRARANGEIVGGRPEQRGQGGVTRLEWVRESGTNRTYWAERRTP